MFSPKEAIHYLKQQPNLKVEWEDVDNLYADLGSFRVRVLPRCIQMGWLQSWDRWASSADFELYQVPDVEDFEDFLHYCLNQGFLDPGWGNSVDVYPYLRQYRRELARTPEFKAERKDPAKWLKFLNKNRTRGEQTTTVKHAR